MNNLKKKYERLKRNKENTKLLIIDAMSISSIDFTPEHASHKLTNMISICLRRGA